MNSNEENRVVVIKKLTRPLNKALELTLSLMTTSWHRNTIITEQKITQEHRQQTNHSVCYLTIKEKK
jgi:hypothetical protein